VRAEALYLRHAESNTFIDAGFGTAEVEGINRNIPDSSIDECFCTEESNYSAY
jgi:hypothetical protein